MLLVVCGVLAENSLPTWILLWSLGTCVPPSQQLEQLLELSPGVCTGPETHSQKPFKNVGTDPCLQPLRAHRPHVRKQTCQPGMWPLALLLPPRSASLSLGSSHLLTPGLSLVLPPNS